MENSAISPAPRNSEAPARAALSDEGLLREEAGVNRLAWASALLTACLAALAIVAVIAMLISNSDNYALAASLIVLPVVFGLPTTLYVRKRHIDVYRNYHSRMVLKTLELQEVALTDALTGLYNRQHFHDKLEELTEKALAGQSMVSIITLDLDGLKSINDNYGHTVGDEVIANFGRLLSRLIRDSDMAARLGGDEFGIMMRGTDKSGAFALARRLWAELAQTPMYEQGETTILVNVSIGVAGYPWGGETADELLQWADTDMYANKVSRKVQAHLPQAADPTITAAAELDSIADFDVRG